MSRSADGAAVKLSPIDWDAILDRAFQSGPFSRITKVNDWQVVAGMQVDLQDALNLGTKSGKLLILCDALTAAKQPGRINLWGFTDVLIVARSLKEYFDTQVWCHSTESAKDKVFTISFYSKLPTSFEHRDGRRAALKEWILYSSASLFYLGNGTAPVQTELSGAGPGGGYFGKSRQMPFPFASLPRDACRAFLSRMLLAAQSEASDGRREIASELLDRLQQILSLFPEDYFPELVLECAATRELIQPVQLESGQVPYLSPDVYAGVATAYGPALKAFADTFTNFLNRNFDLEQRKQAARLLLAEKGDAVSFQTLVSSQLSENLRIANENVAKAQRSLESQQPRVKQAESTFKSGMESWENAQKRDAAFAIVGAVFEFAGGVASTMSGNPGGAASAAKAAADVAKTASRLAEIMQKLIKIAAVIGKLVKLCAEIYAASIKIVDAKDLANRMSAATVETNDQDMQGAPSAGAYWDQLWVEVETNLAVPVQERIDGASEYLKELKILIIYGRALTTAQAALPPLIQEIARATLQAEIAKRQRANLEQEVARLQTGQAAPAEAAAALWLRYRMAQRSMLVALQNFDAAYRYWALIDTPVRRDPNRSIGDIAGELIEIANIKDRQREALQRFVPQPQPYRKESYTAPQSALDEFLRTGELVLRFTPGRSPFDRRGRVGRVRVNDICVWVEWISGKRPATGKVEFTVRTNGVYDDQRIEAGKTKSFHFIATPLNLTFRYDVEGYSREKRFDAITTPASVAEEFRVAYSEPTLFSEWRLSLPAGGDAEDDTLGLTSFQSAINGITVEFSGTFIKDSDRLFHPAMEDGPPA